MAEMVKEKLARMLEQTIAQNGGRLFELKEVQDEG